MKTSVNKEDRVVLVDVNGLVLIDGSRICSLPKLAAHQKGIRHLAISVFLFNSAGELLIQQRAISKYHSPGLWSNTSCTHPRIGEDPRVAARRRLFEEMGIEAEVSGTFTLAYRAEVGDGFIENEFDHIFFGQSDSDPVPDPAEVKNWKWFSMNVLEHEMSLNPSKYTPWFLILWPMVKKHLPKFKKCRFDQ